MYTEPSKLTKPTSNNTFSFDKRKSPVLYIPSIKEGTIDDLELGNETVFEDIDENNELKTCKGLKNFIRTDYEGAPMIIVDNHNHVFYFWYEARSKGLIDNNLTLIHIDQHSDMREPESFLSKEDSKDLQKIYNYTNTVLNVGNFIVPAIKEGIIKEAVQVRGEEDMRNIEVPRTPFILDIDLDFFAPELDYIDFNLSKEKIQTLAKKASLITVATSPFFIDQDLAIEKLKKLLS